MTDIQKIKDKLWFQMSSFEKQIDDFVDYEDCVFLRKIGFDKPTLFGAYGKKMKFTYEVDKYGNEKLVNWNKKERKSFSIPTLKEVFEYYKDY
tara:strand:+ start:269 stop:547 length:279 start_codon:yes stop_codon:yes gene_type:complete